MFYFMKAVLYIYTFI